MSVRADAAVAAAGASCPSNDSLTIKTDEFNAWDGCTNDSGLHLDTDRKSSSKGSLESTVGGHALGSSVLHALSCLLCWHELKDLLSE